MDNICIGRHCVQQILGEFQLIAPDAAEHGKRVQIASLKVANQLGHFTEEELSDLSVASLFHDVGKMLLKIEPYAVLRESDLEEIRRHTLLGYLLLKSRGLCARISEVALFHHEWFDGSGYPFGLAGEEIPLFARICAVADAFEVMVTGRPYQPPMSIDDALLEIRRYEGVQFDPIVANEFLRNPLFFSNR